MHLDVTAKNANFYGQPHPATSVSMNVTSQNTVMAPLSGTRQMSTSKTVPLASNKVTVTKAGAEDWRLCVLKKSLERAQRLSRKVEYQARQVWELWQ